MGAFGLRKKPRAREPAQTSATNWDLLDIFPDATLAVDKSGTVVTGNALAAKLFALTPDELVGSSLRELFSNSIKSVAALRGRNSSDPLPARRSDGTEFPAEVSLSAAQVAEAKYSVLMIKDATARVRADALKLAEKHILEIMASGAPVREVLDTLARNIEAVSDGMQASILLYEKETNELVHGSAPSLPAEYVKLVSRVPVGPKVGSCGTAAYRKQPVIVSDIAHDPLWQDWKQAALPHGLRACWSSPILAADGEVLGTFALYYSEPRSPADFDVEVVQRATHLAGIAIERHLAEQLRQATEGRYRRLSELTSDFAYAFSFSEDGSARIEWVTDAFSRITGYDVEEWESRGAWRGLLHPEDVLPFEQRLPRLLRGEEVSSEVRIVTKSGDVRWLSVYSRPIWDEHKKRVVGVEGAAQDFTTRKEAEDAKTMFLATASHELKTPLTVIQGFAQLMGNERISAGGVQKEAAETIERRAKELNKILERILLSSRIETGRTQVTLGDVDLGPILQERVDALQGATGREVAFHADELPVVLADADVVSIVVDHLLDNAVKYSPDGGPIHVEAHAANNVVSVSVADKGIGMTPEQAARCFEKFWQAESSDIRRFGGTGIGLFIVRSLVEAMGGEIRVESEPDKGSTFTFTLRVSQEASHRSQPGTGQRTSILEFMRQLGVPEANES